MGRCFHIPTISQCVCVCVCVVERICPFLDFSTFCRLTVDLKFFRG